MRNKDSNPRNNLRRRILKIERKGILFPISDIVKLTPEQMKYLESWNGTKFEIQSLRGR